MKIERIGIAIGFGLVWVILVSIFFSALKVPSVLADGNTLTVCATGCDYGIIQDAIETVIPSKLPKAHTPMYFHGRGYGRLPTSAKQSLYRAGTAPPIGHPPTRPLTPPSSMHKTTGVAFTSPMTAAR